MTLNSFSVYIQKMKKMYDYLSTLIQYKGERKQIRWVLVYNENNDEKKYDNENISIWYMYNGEYEQLKIIRIAWGITVTLYQR